MSDQADLQRYSPRKLSRLSGFMAKRTRKKRQNKADFQPGCHFDLNLK